MKNFSSQVLIRDRLDAVATQLISHSKFIEFNLCGGVDIDKIEKLLDGMRMIARAAQDQSDKLSKSMRDESKEAVLNSEFKRD